MGKIVLFAEGQGDDKSLRALVGKLLSTRQDIPQITLCAPSFLESKWEKLSAPNGSFQVLRDRLKAAVRQHGADVTILILFDADQLPVIRGRKLPACEAAKIILEKAGAAEAGIAFSLVVVVAEQEYESWFISARDQLAGETVDGIRMKSGPFAAPPAPEKKRGAKEWVKKHLLPGYNEPTHQVLLTRLMLADPSAVRQSSRSFRRMENAVEEIALAAKEGRRLLSPTRPCCPHR